MAYDMQKELFELMKELHEGQKILKKDQIDIINVLIQTVSALNKIQSKLDESNIINTELEKISDLVNNIIARNLEKHDD